MHPKNILLELVDLSDTPSQDDGSHAPKNALSEFVDLSDTPFKFMDFRYILLLFILKPLSYWANSIDIDY